MRFFLLWMIVIMTLLAGCSGEVKVLEEDKEANIRIKEVNIKEVRKGPDLGLRIRMRLQGYVAGDPACLVRCTPLSEKNEAFLNPTFIEILIPDSLEEEGSILEMDSSTAVYGLSRTREFDPVVEVFLPYQYLPIASGEQSIHLDLEVLDTGKKMIAMDNMPQVQTSAKAMERIGYQRLAYDFTYPDLHAVRIWVQSIELDTTLFDPHSADISLFKMRPEYGYPDLAWSLGAGYETMFQSDYYLNSLKGEWKWPSEPFYIDGWDEEILLCAQDWDDKRFIKQQDDALACWEGKIRSLSRDPAQPTFLSFDLVKSMAVVALWDGALPQAEM